MYTHDVMAEERTERVAVLVPCHNEEATVGRVVRDFRDALPDARVYVFDNASTDRTAEEAAAAGAVVVASPRKGKGHVVMQMFREVEADWYVMVDGDSTYPATSAPGLLQAARREGADMVIGRRVTPATELARAYRPMHQLGNRMVCRLIRATFGSPVRDVFSGFRVFSSDFVKTAPLAATGFDTEIEMTLQALSKGYRVTEADVPYTSRPSGSVSKLNTYRDGARVLAAFFGIFRDHRPGLFFGLLAAALALASLAAGLAPVIDYVRFQYVYRVPLAVLATGLAVLAALSASIGLILQTQLRYHNETHALLRRISRATRSDPDGAARRAE
jgi:glycosyltransferase involved in cell wall biosynthesis